MIGIFGDSFAAQSHETTWPSFLKLLINDNVETHAVAASSLQFSIDLFLKNHTKYDKIVFLTTHVPRLTLPVSCVSNADNSTVVFDQWAGLGQVEYALENYSADNKILEKLFDYFVWIAGDNSQQLYHDITYTALLVYIKSIRPDTILIPCFSSNGFSYYKDMGYTWSLCDISSFELQRLNINGFPPNDPRSNHLSVENNKWLADHVASRLDGNFLNWNPTTSFQFTSVRELEEHRYLWSR